METVRWACVNYEFGKGGQPKISVGTIRWRKADSIAEFINGSGAGWNYWHTKVGWQCVKVKVTIEVI